MQRAIEPVTTAIRNLVFHDHEGEMVPFTAETSEFVLPNNAPNRSSMRQFPTDQRKVTRSVDQLEDGQSTVWVNKLGHKTEYRVFKKIRENRVFQMGYVTGKFSNIIIYKYYL